MKPNTECSTRLSVTGAAPAPSRTRRCSWHPDAQGAQPLAQSRQWRSSRNPVLGVWAVGSVRMYIQGVARSAGRACPNIGAQPSILDDARFSGSDLPRSRKIRSAGLRRPPKLGFAAKRNSNRTTTRASSESEPGAPIFGRVSGWSNFGSALEAPPSLNMYRGPNYPRPDTLKLKNRFVQGQAAKCCISQCVE